MPYICFPFPVYIYDNYIFNHKRESASSQKPGDKPGQDLKDLIRNRPWMVLLGIGVLFSVFNSIKQGIVVIYFTHYLHNPLLTASFLIALAFASIGER